MKQRSIRPKLIIYYVVLFLQSIQVIKNPIKRILRKGKCHCITGLLFYLFGQIHTMRLPLTGECSVWATEFSYTLREHAHQLFVFKSYTLRHLLAIIIPNYCTIFPEYFYVLYASKLLSSLLSELYFCFLLNLYY